MASASQHLRQVLSLFAFGRIYMAWFLSYDGSEIPFGITGTWLMFMDIVHLPPQQVAWLVNL
jgi:hypothetical protein